MGDCSRLLPWTLNIHMIGAVQKEGNMLMEAEAAVLL
jgi:hypothetical protein